MIFVTVGVQLPFDRLIKTIDLWAEKNNRIDIFAQTGTTNWRPLYIEAVNLLSPVEFQNRLQSAELIVGHAGMGTIITAMEYGKPLLVMPRDAALGEHRNNHQLATAKRFASLQYVDVAFNEEELVNKLDKIKEVRRGEVKRIGSAASPELIAMIRHFIETD